MPLPGCDERVVSNGTFLIRLNRESRVAPTNPLLETSESRKFASWILAVSFVLTILVSTYVLGGDWAVIGWVTAPIVAGLLGSIGWYYHKRYLLEP